MTEETTAPEKSFRLRKVLFVLSIAALIYSIAAYLWPVAREDLLLISGADGKLGYINTDGRMVIEPAWKSARPFDKKGMAAVLDENNKWGWINRSGEVVIEPRWDADLLEEFGPEFDEGDMAIVSKETDDGKVEYGWIDRRGQIVIPVDYSRAVPFDSHGLARVTWGVGRYRWLSRTGKVVIELPADHSSPLSSHDQGEHGLRSYRFNSAGKMLIPEHSKWGIMDTTGRVIVPPRWDNIGQADELGMSRTYKVFSTHGWVSKDGEIITPAEWSWLTPFDVEDMSMAQKGYLVGWVGRDGHVIEPAWDAAEPFNGNGLAPVRRDRLWGWVDKNGELQVEPQWNTVGQFDSIGWIRVTRGGLHGWADREGKLVLPLTWDLARDFDSHGMASVENGGKQGWINREGSLVIPLQWERTRDFGTLGLARVSEGSKWGWIDRDGQVAIPLEWDDARPFSEKGLALVSKNGLWGMIDHTGNLVIDVEYKLTEHSVGWSPDDKDVAEYGFTALSKNGDTYVATPSGRLVGPILEYESFRSFGGSWYFSYNLFQDSGFAVDLDGGECFLTDGLLSRFDDYGHSVIFAPVYPDDVPRKGPFELYVHAMVDQQGNEILRLPKGQWIPVPSMDDPWKSKPTQSYPVRKEPLYAFRKREKLSGLRLWWLKVRNWISSEGDGKTELEYICHVYARDGKLVWSSAWISFESKCLLASVLALVVALVANPFGFLRSRSGRGGMDQISNPSGLDS